MAARAGVPARGRTAPDPKTLLCGENVALNCFFAF